MSWIRLDNGFPEHPKVLGLTDAAFRAEVIAICYASRYLTDGWVPAPPRRALASELVKAQLWLPDGDGYQLHDYLDWQQSRAQAQARSDRARQAARKRWGT